MMRMLVPVVLLVLGVGGGVGAGFMLGGSEAEPPAEDATAELDPEASAQGDGDGEGEGDGDGEAEGAEETTASANPPRVERTGSNTEFVRLNNQFVVPVVRDGTVRSLVVLGLAVEVSVGQSGTVFSQELRLRDSFLRVLFAHANAGGFDGRFTEAEAMAPLREALTEAAAQILGRDATYDVLITDVTRQDA